MEVTRTVLKHSCSLFAPRVRSDVLAPFYVWPGNVTYFCQWHVNRSGVWHFQEKLLGASAFFIVSPPPMDFRKHMLIRIYDHPMALSDYDEQSPCQSTFIMEHEGEGNLYQNIEIWGMLVTSDWLGLSLLMYLEWSMAFPAHKRYLNSSSII